MRIGKWRAGNIRPAGMVSEDRKKVRKERREITGPGKQAGEEEGLCQELLSTGNSREKSRDNITTSISVCTVCSSSPLQPLLSAPPSMAAVLFSL